MTSIRILASLALLAGNGSAYAAIANGVQHLVSNDANSASSGELFLSVWDASAALSYSVDLGVTVEQFLAQPYARTWHLDQRFKDFAASGHALKFNIAANNTYQGINAAGVGSVPSSYGVLSSVLNQAGAISLAQARTGSSGSSLQQLSSPIQARINHLNLSAVAQDPDAALDPAAMTQFSAHLSEVTDGNNDAYFAYFPRLWGDNLSNRFAFSTSAAIRDSQAGKDQTLRLYFFGLQGAGINKVVATDIGGGKKLFGLDANNGLLAWGGGGKPVNHAPVAKAGSGQTVPAGATVLLDGGASDDPDPGDTLSYAWTQIAGAPVTLSGADTATPSFTATGGRYLFSLAVTDSQGITKVGTVPVKVSNRAPVISLAIPKAVTAGSPVTLDARASADPDGGGLSYVWTQMAGPTLGLSGADSAMPSFTAGAAGDTYLLALTVTDSQGASTTRSVKMVVGGAPKPTNRPPVPNITAPAAVATGGTVTLDARASTDPDGDALNYVWTQVAGPAVALNGAHSAQASFTAGMVGARYNFVLTVTDSTGSSAIRGVKIGVANTASVVKITAPRTVGVGTPVTLDGSASTDPDGGGLSYAWHSLAGPGAELSGTDTAIAGFTPDVAGVYWFTLVVTDDQGVAKSGLIAITVTP